MYFTVDIVFESCYESVVIKVATLEVPTSASVRAGECRWLNLFRSVACVWKVSDCESKLGNSRPGRFSGVHVDQVAKCEQQTCVGVSVISAQRVAGQRQQAVGNLKSSRKEEAANTLIGAQMVLYILNALWINIQAPPRRHSPPSLPHGPRPPSAPPPPLRILQGVPRWSPHVFQVP